MLNARDRELLDWARRQAGGPARLEREARISLTTAKRIFKKEPSRLTDEVRRKLEKYRDRVERGQTGMMSDITPEPMVNLLGQIVYLAATQPELLREMYELLVSPSVRPLWDDSLRQGKPDRWRKG